MNPPASHLFPSLKVVNQTNFESKKQSNSKPENPPSKQAQVSKPTSQQVKPRNRQDEIQLHHHRRHSLGGQPSRSHADRLHRVEARPYPQRRTPTGGLLQLRSMRPRRGRCHVLIRTRRFPKRETWRARQRRIPFLFHLFFLSRAHVLANGTAISASRFHHLRTAARETVTVGLN